MHPQNISLFIDKKFFPVAGTLNLYILFVIWFSWPFLKLDNEF